ncbi:CAF17-like 4Fe-4S cluster assembly/insertion protein YgfZ [Sansalvadorimonas verongulae]|uniref:CAF17-like 4Fe-4S cluster assembly/insertion protein YgfZ n=1 Tax=Sansalvadorimonas verongulae TaxID=2172824 RepID=UPI0018AD2D23|nr:folate-binding protein YgfZ [Sansalvadorimonas verongulae]
MSSGSQPYLTRLDHQHLLSFSGQESKKFLQGQLTCDVVKLENNQTVYGACCTPKGRMVANFRTIAHNDDLILSLPADQSEVLHQHLKKYAMFFRTVSIENVSESWVRMGLGGKGAAPLIASVFGEQPTDSAVIEGDAGLAFVASDHSQRFELWIKPEQAEAVWEKLSEKATAVPTTHWQLADIKDGIAWVTEASREEWIPQHLNWQAVNGVSFNKGCYTGQEIVARMKYLGKLKSRLYRFTLEGQNVPAIGSVINNEAGNKSGNLVSALASPASNTVELMAVVRKDDIESAMTLAETNTPLYLQSLPYDVED